MSERGWLTFFAIAVIAMLGGGLISGGLSFTAKSQPIHDCPTCLIKTRPTPYRLVLEFDSEYDLRHFTEFLRYQTMTPYQPEKLQFTLTRQSDGAYVLRSP